MTPTISRLVPAGPAIVGLIMCAGAAFADCPGADQQEMNHCAAAEYQKADAELTKVYSKLDKTPELRAAERAWIAYRDAECAYETASNRGGSMEPMINAGCMTTMTKQRIAVLKAEP
jgi:uncharacterized protein YecT (DUF1311 family)